MKKGKLTKRIIAFLLMSVMILSISTTAFAAEVGATTTEQATKIASENEESVEMRSTAQEKTIPAWGNTKFYFEKNHIFPERFYVSTSSNSMGGAVIVTATNSSNPGTELSDNWVMGTTDEASWMLITLAGTIIIQVNNHSDAPIDVRVWF